MGRKEKVNSILLATTSFIGGIVAGLLLAPNKGSRNRAWVSDQANELADWVDTHRKNARHKSGQKLHQLRNNMQHGVRQNLPDLYEATENIDLSKNDIISE